ncbi:hypothetical protein ACHQM5_015235 [Ranunculus cassubicifolius]
MAGDLAPKLKIEEIIVLPSARKTIETLWDWLNNEHVGTIGIQGDPLMGKTWTARKLMNRAIKDNLFEIIIWVHGAQNNYETQVQIADQLKLTLDDEYWVDTYVKEIKLKEKISELLAERHFLLILDDISSYNLEELGVPHPKGQNKSSKVLLTLGPGTNLMADKVHKLEKLSKDETLLLFQNTATTELVSEDNSLYASEMAQQLLDRCMGVPFEIVILAGALRSFESTSSAITTLPSLQMQANMQRAYDLIFNSSNMSRLHFICEMLPDKDVKDCFLFCATFPMYYEFSVKGLIRILLKSGFLDGFDSLQKAYEKGQNILDELLNRHLLIRKFDDMLLVQTQLVNDAHEYIINRGFDIHLMERFSLAGGTGTDRKQQLPILLKNGNLLLSYPDNNANDETSSSLLLYEEEGCPLPGLPDAFFENMLNLQDVSLIHLRSSSLPESLSKLNSLNVLVVRDCGSLDNVNQISTLRNLRVLSISGARSLKEMEDDFFLHLGGLENLELSNTQLKQLPSSFSNLCKIRFLVLRGCSHLEALPSLKKFHQLYVLDLSGATGLMAFPEISNSLRMLDLSGTRFGRIPSEMDLINLEYLNLSRCLLIKTVPHPYALPQLIVLDLSGASAFTEFEGVTSGTDSPLIKLDLSRTGIVTFPSLSRCIKLCEVLLRSCSKLETLPSFGAKLEVLDLSGSVSLEEFPPGSIGIDLITLDLSRTRIDKLVTEAANLIHLLLKECEYLEELPHLEFPNLQVLDLSGSFNFKKFEDDSLGKLCRLGILNLSNTQVGVLPALSECSHLRQILLRGCLKLETLPALISLIKLEVLDVSGATSFRQFEDESLGVKEHFRELNLSGTQVLELSIFSECHNLCKLIVSECSKLKMLLPLEPLQKLQVLDVSGSTLFTTFQDQSLQGKYDFQILEVSRTQVEELPSLSGCINLRQLLVRDCPNFKTLPNLRELIKLEVLDLSGDSSFSQINRDSLGNNLSLKNLDLSGTKVTDFQFVSECKNLSQLSLRGCSNLETLSFEGMHNLRKLDLSESPIEILSPTISELCSLRKLLLRGCSGLKSFPHPESLAKLEVLDLSGTSVGIPDGISNLTHLRFLRLLNRKYIWEFDRNDSVEVKVMLNSDLCGAEESGVDHLHVTATGADIFLLIEKNLKLNGRDYGKFHFCLCSTEEWRKEKDIYLPEKGFIFKDMYYQTFRIPQLTNEPDKFFKICGFYAFPHGIEPVLSQVELLYLKANDFITRLADVGAEHVKLMRECWIERCNKIENTFYGEEVTENMALGRCLENLCISNLSNLKCLFKGVFEYGGFTCLKHIYVECCPRLKTIFSSHLELKKLESLTIKFCDQLGNIFEESVLGEETLPQLKTLVLWQLPKLQDICRGVLPSLGNIRIKGCPMLQMIPVGVNNSNRRVKIKGDMVWWNNLRFEHEWIKSNLHFTQL